MIPRHIQDQISAYHAHSQKAKEHLSKANKFSKNLLRERKIDVDSNDHDYRWNLLGEKCPDSPIGVCVKDGNEDFKTFAEILPMAPCIFCGKVD